MSRSCSVGIGAALASVVTWSMCDLTSWSIAVEVGGLEQAASTTRWRKICSGSLVARSLATSSGAAVGHGVALEMPEIAVQPDMDQAGAAAARGRARSPRGRPRRRRRSRARRPREPACRSPRPGRSGCRPPTRRWPCSRRSRCPRRRRSPAGSRPWRGCSSRAWCPGSSRRRRRRRSPRRRS